MALGLCIGPTAAQASPATPRWPTWPTEVRTVGGPLVRNATGAERVGERQRIAAVAGLREFATDTIVKFLLVALDDPSAQVRRDALRLCYERELVACIPAAAGLWAAGGEPTVRIAALRVLSLDPEPTRAALIIEALRDPSEVVRAEAAEFLGTARLSPSVRETAATALLAKLADVSITVRRRAVHSLGILGAGTGTLSIARLLSDPEPSVRAAAAEALGRYRDADAVPALRRALAAPNESMVALALVEALAVLPDPSVEDDLLALLDDPPPGLNPVHVATAIGRRPAPSIALAEGLVARLSETARTEAALRGLLLLGEAARPALEGALARGVEPATQMEVERLLGALAVDAAAPDSRVDPWPDAEDQRAWRTRLEIGDALSRRRAAWALARIDPPWRVPLTAAMVGRPGTIEGRRAWVLGLAASAQPWQASSKETAARLEGWARDRELSASDRCLAVLALGAASPAARRPSPPWADLAADDHPSVRACAALALGRHQDHRTLSTMLLDPHARVRTTAAMALSLCEVDDITDSTRVRLALMAKRDTDGAVRAAAQLATAHLDSGAPLPSAPQLFETRVDPYRWIAPATELEVELSGLRLWVPIVGAGPWRWMLVPGFEAAIAAEKATL